MLQSNHCNITLNKEMLPLLHPLGSFEHHGLLRWQYSDMPTQLIQKF